MRFQWLVAAVLASTVLAEGIVEDLVDKLTGHSGNEPVLTVTASFPEDNPFGHVTNGERNKMNIHIEVTSDQNITVRNIAGSFHNPDTYAFIKNTTSLSYGMYLISGSTITVPYGFHSELKPGDVRLLLWVEHEIEGTPGKYRAEAFDSVVSIVEPPLSLLDWKMLSTYLIVALSLSGLAYIAYTSFFPASPRRRSKPKTEKISNPVGTVTATGAGGYEEEWIPALHLKKNKKSGNKSDGVLSSGDESGAGGGKKKGKRA